MKRRILLSTLLLVIAIQANAQTRIRGDPPYKMFAELNSYRNLNFDRASKAYLGSLNYSSCYEIIECGLAHVAMLRLAQPKATSKSLTNKVEELAIRGETLAIRYKAYLTSMVFVHPELFTYEKHGDYKNGDELFTALAQRLQEEALAVK